MSVAYVDPIEERQARAAAELDAKCVRAYTKARSFTKAAKALGVTSARVRAGVERCGGTAEAPTLAVWSAPLDPTPPPPRPRDDHEPPAPTRDLAGDPVDVEEVRGWLALRKAGWHDSDIADEAEVDAHQVAQLCSVVARRDHEAAEEEGDGRAKAPRLNPRFPIEAFTPGMRCRHDRTPIPKGSRDYCPVCDRSGLDGLHPALHRNPKLDPPPEPKAKPKAARPLTRAEKRKALAAAVAEHERDAERTKREAKAARRLAAEAARRDANR